MNDLSSLTSLLALAAGVAFVVVNVAAAARSPRSPRHSSAWWWPAAFGVAFAVFSLLAVLREGALGFWPEHSLRGLWGNQIWFDLLLAASAAFALALPRLRAQGMNLWLWLALIVASGSIALMAMLARLWWLESRAAR